MTDEEITKMLRESLDTDKVDAWGNGFWTITQAELLKFAALVTAAEREACAKVCEQAGIDGYGTLAAAAMIRARGEE
jgi:hypothetical protein